MNEEDLRLVQLMECLRKQVDGVKYKSGLRLKSVLKTFVFLFLNIFCFYEFFLHFSPNSKKVHFTKHDIAKGKI